MRITKAAIKRAMESNTVLTYRDVNDESNFLRRVRSIMFPFVQWKKNHEYFSCVPGKRLSKKAMIDIVQKNL